MFIVLGISLYTSRIILNSLGVVDYGIYNVVGGLSTLFSFLLSTLTTSTERFFALKIALNKENEINKTFSIITLLYIALSVIIVILCEAIGLPLLYYKLNIPVERQHAAIIVFHVSVALVFLTILYGPISGLFIAYEKMNLFAYISIIESSLKLLVAIILPYLFLDKLTCYAYLMLIVGLLVFITEIILLKKNFPFLKIKKYKDTKLIKEIVSFSSWNAFSSLSSTLSNQGVVILINIFFGPTANAAKAISGQVNGAIGSFTSNIQIAVNPQIIKHWGGEYTHEFNKLILNSSKYSFLLISLILCPVILEIPFILKIWLVNFPDDSVIFCRLVFLQIIVMSISRSYVTGVNAIGIVKKLNIYASSSLLLVLPITYALYKLKLPAYVSFIVYGIALVAEFVVAISILTKSSNLRLAELYNRTFLPIIKVLLVAVPVPVILHFYLDNGMAKLTLICITSLFFFTTGTFFLATDNTTREMIINKIKNGAFNTHNNE